MVGIDGIEALQSNVSDAAGNMSHDGLIAWLESRGMGSLEALVAQHEGWHDLENRRHGMNRNHGGAASRFLSSSSKAQALMQDSSRMGIKRSGWHASSLVVPLCASARVLARTLA